MRLSIFALGFSLACSGDKNDSGHHHDGSDTSAVDSGVADSGGNTDQNELPGNLHGTEPAQPVLPPEFSATSHDGGLRSQTDLLGHPTVMWFFPAAATPG